ncbi:hypothetical protein LINGRAHAP2_LOCUS11500 [Linum grandiflorum]
MKALSIFVPSVGGTGTIMRAVPKTLLRIRLAITKTLRQSPQTLRRL